MLKKIPAVIVIILFPCLLAAQTVQVVRDNARKYLQQGDYSNAVMVLNRCLQQAPDNMELNRDLAYTYYLQRDYARALQAITPLLEREDADIVTYQIGGNIYKALEEVKDCDKMYKKALKKFPASGALYSEYGELLWAKEEPQSAIATWEKGISSDPSWPGNYYHAAKYYFTLADRVWSLVYGEIFINMESYSDRTSEMKMLLLESYKKLYTQSEVFSKYSENNKSDFEDAVLSIFSKYTSDVAGGITPLTLNTIRTKFVTDWFQKNAKLFPYKLFEQWQFMVKEGMFEAYNQWIFGPVANMPEYELWLKANDKSVAQFNYYQRNRVFKMPAGQYYGNVQR